MTVYIAERLHEYEGSDIIGVFTTREAAQQAIDADPETWNSGYEISEHVIDAVTA